MVRYKIAIEYDGSHFKGWQRQKNAASVQSTIEQAIKKFSNEDVLVYGSGRTDGGVHAIRQIAHFDLNKNFNIKVIKNAINHFIKPYISILSINEVDQSFHARFSAIKKRYLYKVINRDSNLTLMKNYAWLVKNQLNVDDMIKSSKLLLGKHDFTSFRSASCQANSPVRTIDNIIIDSDNELIQFSFEAKSFLHNQVRIMVGGLVAVGVGKWSLERLNHSLMAKDRKLGPITAPPHGLYLKEVCY